MGGHFDLNHKFHGAVQYANHRLCACSIISNNHVMTASSCIILEKTNHHVVTLSNLKVLVGTNDEFNTYGHGKLYNVQYVIWHDDYNPGMFWKNDIAILRLETPIELSDTCSKIDLPIKHIYFNSIMTLTNWEENLININNKFLKFLEVKALVQSGCAKKYPHFKFDFRTQNCAKIDRAAVNNFAFTSVIFFLLFNCFFFISKFNGLFFSRVTAVLELFLIKKLLELHLFLDQINLEL